MVTKNGMSARKILRIRRVKTKTRTTITIAVNEDMNVNDGLAKSADTLTETGSYPPGIKTEIIATAEVEAPAVLNLYHCIHNHSKMQKSAPSSEILIAMPDKK
jgi:hypothetical protein